VRAGTLDDRSWFTPNRAFLDTQQTGLSDVA
jgi:hypothetical protein